jgi:membrane glycosyltransferase
MNRPAEAVTNYREWFHSVGGESRNGVSLPLLGLAYSSLPFYLYMGPTRYSVVHYIYMGHLNPHRIVGAHRMHAQVFLLHPDHDSSRAMTHRTITRLETFEPRWPNKLAGNNLFGAA